MEQSNKSKSKYCESGGATKKYEECDGAVKKVAPYSYHQHLSRVFINLKKQYDVYANYYKKNIYKFLPRDKDSKIVDLGCGLGHVLYFLRKEGYSNCLGVDIASENVEICQEKGFNTIQRDLNDYIAYSQDRVDAFILSNVLEHFDYENIIRIVNSLYKLLEKGGVILIILPNCNNIYGLATYFSDITHKSPLTEKSLEDLILQTSVKDYCFYNTIAYPNLFLIDFVFKIYNKFLFGIRKINNMVHGQKPFCVQSKNLLLVIKK